MVRLIAAGVLPLLAAAMIWPAVGRAALEVVVSVSPAQGVVGRPVEILVRTFSPVAQGDIALPTPSLAYPAASGLWNVLYPIADYPFDVVAEASDAATVPVPIARDPNDATLWRGVFTPATSGTWTIRVRNFPDEETGASVRFEVAGSEEVGTGGSAALAPLLTGVVTGIVIGRVTSRRWRRSA
jgi:membrane associated rhomboid family serine protease